MAVDAHVDPGILRARRRAADAKTRRGRRVLERRASKVVEDPKVMLVLKGHATSALVCDALGEWAALARPYVQRLTRRNPGILPFEPGKEALVEAQAGKFDASLFLLGNHTKKRPHNLILGRLYDGRLLDMIEMGVTQLKKMTEFRPQRWPEEGAKPCFLFVGEPFENDERMRKVKNLFLGGLNLISIPRIQYPDICTPEQMRSNCAKSTRSTSRAWRGLLCSAPRPRRPSSFASTRSC